MPTPLLGGVLVWIGGGLIHQWLISAHARLARAEYAVVVLIFAIIAFVGFAWGILVGLIAAAVLFAVEYGRIDIVRYTLTGRDYQTGAGASDERLEVLRANGEAILLLRLQGYLFFGTAERLRKRIQERLADTSKPASASWSSTSIASAASIPPPCCPSSACRRRPRPPASSSC